MLQQPKSRLLAGGTGLGRTHDLSTETLIDLQRLGLSYIRDEGDQFIIGAMTSAYDIYTYPELPESLRNAAYQIGDIGLLHAVTVGGNLARLYSWVDLPPMLWALNGSVVLYNPEKRILVADEFFEFSQEKNIYRRNALITDIIVQKPPRNSFSDYQSLTTTKHGKGQLNLASSITWNKNKLISEARFVLSAASNYPMRLDVEQLLVGKKLTAELIRECTTGGIEDVPLRRDFRSSVQYRKHILAVYLKRMLKRCQEKIQEE